MKALIFGCTGQDGSFLSELLLEKGYQVVGVARRTSLPNNARISHLGSNPNFSVLDGDVTDSICCARLIRDCQPDELYNLAAQSHVQTSFANPEATANADALGALRILEAIRLFSPKTKFYQASSSEMFGNAPSPQNEGTPFCPVSPYGAAKLYAHWTTVSYRQAYGLFACSGILFNHESPRRGEQFVTRKITKALGEDKPFILGNLEAKRDWGHAKDYVRGMWLMLQQPQPDDYVLATGETNSVRTFLKLAAGYSGRRPVWMTDESLERPTEIHELRGDFKKAARVLGWAPTITFEQLVKEMVESDLRHFGQRENKLDGQITVTPQNAFPEMIRKNKQRLRGMLS